MQQVEKITLWYLVIKLFYVYNDSWLKIQKEFQNAEKSKLRTGMEVCENDRLYWLITDFSKLHHDTFHTLRTLSRVHYNQPIISWNKSMKRYVWNAHSRKTIIR